MQLVIQHLDGSSEKYNINDINDLREFLKSFSIPLYIIRGAQSLEEALSLIATHLSRHYSTAYVLKNDDTIVRDNIVHKQEGPLNLKKDSDKLMPWTHTEEESKWGKYVRKRHEPQYDKIVSHKFHADRFPIPAEYDKIFAMPVKKLSEHTITGPPLPKIMYNVSEIAPELQRYPGEQVRIVVKPYHNRLSIQDKPFMNKPLYGWSTMTTNALYRAGGIGHLTDEVFTGVRKKIPIIVHKDTGVDTRPLAMILQEARKNKPKIKQKTSKVYQLIPPQKIPKINQLHLQQIALMDYLINHVERSNHDLMVKPKPETTGPHAGLHSIVATNHGTAFQYQKGVAAPSMSSIPHDSPAAYFHRLIPEDLKHVMGPEPHPHELAEWWQKYGTAIRDTFYKHTQAIKSARIRRHLRKNFNDRWNLINQWATPNTPGNYQERHIFDEDFPYKGRIIPMEPHKHLQRQARHVRQKLSKDPEFAAHALAEMTSNLPHAAELGTEVLAQIFHEMRPDELRHSIRNYYHHPVLNIMTAIRNGILKKPRIETEKIRAVLDTIADITSSKPQYVWERLRRGD